ncbi:MAG: hypothetical protein LBP95_14495 [Deltaproteobacteria bacterium]|nr:hypothetical protein [Deltaproteobacteria bacterium]
MLNKYYQIKKASSLGDDTAPRAGRTIDNRLSYLSRWGLLAAFLTFFGRGKQVKIDPAKLADPNKQIKEIHLFGMRANTVLAGASLIFCLVFDNMILVFFFSTLFMANLQISLFGLLPVPDLDGYAMFSKNFTQKTKDNLTKYKVSLIILALFVLSLLFHAVFD